MMNRIVSAIRRIGEKRFAALALAPGFLALGLDASIAHFAGKDEPDHPAQLVPLFFAPVAFALVVLVAWPRLAPRLFTLLLRIVGALTTLVGGVGTVLHLKALWWHLKDDAITWDALNQALSVAPPAFAPAAFVGFGALLWLLASPRFELRYEPSEPAPAAAPTPIATPDQAG